MKKITLLNGSSSSGKSTLSAVLKTLIKKEKNENYEIISIDNFLKMSSDKTIYEDDVFEISSDMCEKSKELLVYADGIIIDHVITSERIFNDLKECLTDYKIYLIHVYCPLSVLKKRETERKNRSVGSAEASYNYLFPKTGYNLTVNTSEFSAEECASDILKIIQTEF
ncbi:MAG TPA: hypothetical protein PLS66_08930 [Tepiditoga sp.]|nr:hypothetical protein [Tepiditoga sp.]